MGEVSPGTSSTAVSPAPRLDSWKEIAAYLNRDVTTVQRWEKREGMPVHRHLHNRMGSVYAFPAELDAWGRGRSLRADQENAADTPAANSPGLTPSSTLSKAPVRWKFLTLGVMAVVVLTIGASLWLQRTEYFWRSPIANARFQRLTDFDGVEQAAVISRDGNFVAFLSDRDGPMDVWLTQVGSGQFHNLTNGSALELVNPSIRTLGFSPDGSLVTFWARKQNSSNAEDINTWAVPTLGGEPKLYLQGVAEFDWSRDGSRLAFHTPGAGDPLFVTSGAPAPEAQPSKDKPIFTAPAGLHSHFPSWASDSAFIYFVQGALPDKLDIWRIRPSGGSPEKITSNNGRVTHPVLLNRSTLLYLANDPDGSGPWIYSADVDRRIPHRLTSGLDRYTSLAASADGRRLVATLETTKRTLWRLPLAGSPVAVAASRIPLTTSAGSSPRMGPGYFLYVSATGSSESIWKVVDQAATELWNGPGSHLLGGPAISRDGRLIAFSVVQNGKALLYEMHADGRNSRILTDVLDLQGPPAWAPDGQSIAVAVNDHGIPHLFRVAVGGGSPASLVGEYSVDPAWAPDGRFLLYSGPDIGTTFSVKALTAEGAAHTLPPLTLTRGARHLAFLPDGHALVYLRGEIQHKNLWLVDLQTGNERPLTNLPPDFDIRDFDISADGREVILERAQANSDLVLLDLPQQ